MVILARGFARQRLCRFHSRGESPKRSEIELCFFFLSRLLREILSLPLSLSLALFNSMRDLEFIADSLLILHRARSCVMNCEELSSFRPRNEATVTITAANESLRSS